MCVEQLLLALPGGAKPHTGLELTVHQWGAVVDDFAAQGGQELILGGPEPLAYPGFWQLVRRAVTARIPRVTACLEGSLLEPWVVRELVERQVHVLLLLDSLDRASHDQLHGARSHARALAALELFHGQGHAQCTGVLATATRLNLDYLPALADWAAERGLSRCLWQSMPDGWWPSAELQALRLSPQEKTALGAAMQTVARALGDRIHVAAVDDAEEAITLPGRTRTLRVQPTGEVFRGFSGAGGQCGTLKGIPMKRTGNRGFAAAGD